MKREHKYRAWHIGEKKMYSAEEICVMFCAGELRKYRIFDASDIMNLLGNDKHFEVMQYTGLKDKNGKEIYEGDIILCERKGELVPYKVYIDDETQIQSIISVDGEGDLEGLYDYHFDCQVIGNEWENPELLEKK